MRKGACTLTAITPGHALSDWCAPGAPGVVDEHVKRSACIGLPELPAEIGDPFGRAGVAGQGMTVRSELGGGGVAHISLARGDEYAGTGVDQALGDHPPEALRTSGDQRHLACERKQLGHVASSNRSRASQRRDASSNESVCAGRTEEGVAEKRGAGAGWTAPFPR